MYYNYRTGIRGERRIGKLLLWTLTVGALAVSAYFVAGYLMQFLLK